MAVSGDGAAANGAPAGGGGGRVFCSTVSDGEGASAQRSQQIDQEGRYIIFNN